MGSALVPFGAASPESDASAFPGEGVQRRKIDRPGPALDHLYGLLRIGKLGSQLGELRVQQLAHCGKVHGQVVVLVDAPPAGQEPVEVEVGFLQELQHVEHEHFARREPAADQPLQIIGFQSVGGEVPDPFLAVATVRCRKVGAGNGKSDLLFGHIQPHHN
jgi:hypothetical protein